MSMVDGDLLDELLGTLDGRARYAVEARFGCSTVSARASARSAKASASPPKPPADSFIGPSPACAPPPSRSSPSNDRSEGGGHPPPGQRLRRRRRASVYP